MQKEIHVTTPRAENIRRSVMQVTCLLFFQLLTVYDRLTPTTFIRTSLTHYTKSPPLNMFWTLLTAFVAASVSSAAASTNQGPTACVSFDINWNLLAFGFNGKDYNVGTQDAWTSSGGVCCAFLRRRFLTVCRPD